MTEPVEVALITGMCAAVPATIAALASYRRAGRAERKVDAVHGQALENWTVSHANHETLAKVAAQTDGNVKKLQEVFEEDARRREAAARSAGYEAGRRAEMTKRRRATDADEEPK